MYNEAKRYAEALTTAYRLSRGTDTAIRFLEHFGISADPSDLTLGQPRVPSPAPAAVIVHPGCSFTARRWPLDRYAGVASWLAGGELPVVVTGSMAERPLALQLATTAGLPADSVLAGRTTLGELAALVADAMLVICGDTGIAHLASRACRSPVGTGSGCSWPPVRSCRTRHAPRCSRTRSSATSRSMLDPRCMSSRTSDLPSSTRWSSRDIDT